jgi:TP901 family phage tail tape measure protein
MANNVEVILSASDASTVRAWLNARDSVAAYEAELGRLDGIQGKNAQSAKKFDDSFNWQEMIGGALATTAAIGGIGGALGIALDYQKQLREDVLKTSLEMDELIRKFQVQAGLKDLEADAANAKIIDLAESNAVSVQDAYAVSTQLVSSGYSNPESTGTTDAMLKILASSNLDASQGAESAKAIGQFLVAFGQEKNAKNLLDVGVRTRGLFQSTDVQVGDLGSFAQAAPAFSNAGVSMQDTMSALAILREAEDAGQAATHGRNVVGLMTTFKSEKAKVDQLKKLKLKPEQLDLVGETLPEALTVLRDAMEAAGLNDAQRSQALKTLYGQENITGASVLLGGIDKFQTFGAFQQDEAGFEQGVRVNQSGAAAGTKRREARTAREHLKKKQQAIQDNALREDFRAQDTADAIEAEDLGVAGLAFRLTNPIKNYAREKALDFGIVTPGGIASQQNRENVQSAGQSNFSMQALKESIDRNTEATKEASKTTGAKLGSVTVTMPGGATPAKPVAAAGIGGNRP